MQGRRKGFVTRSGDQLSKDFGLRQAFFDNITQTPPDCYTNYDEPGRRIVPSRSRMQRGGSPSKGGERGANGQDVPRRKIPPQETPFDPLRQTAIIHIDDFSSGFFYPLYERAMAMQTAKQLSVSLVNKPGRLATLLTALSKAKVNLRALSVMDSGDRGTLRFVPDDADTAKGVLEKSNLRFDTGDVLLADVPNQPGAFRNICEKLAAEHLNIDYAYCSFNYRGGGAMAVIKVNDLAKAQRVLSENGATSRRTRQGRRPVHSR